MSWLSLLLAGFQVATYGRFWVATEASGLSDVEAEEMAIFPGMEELSAMMYVNQYRAEKQFDVIVLDCAPTAESLRFVSLPTTLEWYAKHVFTLQRRILKAVRPIVNRLGPIEAPPDSYFGNLQSLFQKIQGIDTVLEDPQTTSVSSSRPRCLRSLTSAAIG